MDSTIASQTNNAPVRKRRRNRAPVSCNHCRIRKLKCNRSQPCEACRKTGDASTCHYEPRGTDRDDQLIKDTAAKNALSTRINRSETTSRSVIGSNDSPQSDATGHVSEREFDGLSESLGAMKVDKLNNTVYLGSSHWVSILAEIDDIRQHFISNADYYESNALKYQERSWDAKGRSSLLNRTGPTIDQDELMAQVPPRAVVDILINRYFYIYGSVFPIIHEPTFRKEYLNYWSDPSQPIIVWLGLLFAMLHLAELSYGNVVEMPLPLVESLYAPWDFGKRTVDCLILAGYTNPVKYTIETLLLYVEVERMTAQDTGMEGYLVLGIAIRLAMRMGIHRDASDHRRISPFQGEMRRRLWAVIRATDVLYSFQLSFPITIRKIDYNCRTPRNICDADFDENTTELPPPRASDEATEASYTIAKGRILLVLEDVIELIGSSGKMRREDLQKHEEALREAREQVPQYLRTQPINATTADTSNLKLDGLRISIDRAYHLGRCLMYRKFIPQARRYSEAIGHRDNCIDSAMALLGYQATLFLSLCSNRPQGFKKRHLNRLINHDFFLAGILVALDLYAEVQLGISGQISSEVSHWGSNRKLEMMTSLETAIGCWRIAKDESADASKAYAVLSFVLNKVKETQCPAANTGDPKFQLRCGDLWDLGMAGPQQERPIGVVADTPGFKYDMWNCNWNAVDDVSTFFQWPPGDNLANQGFRP